MNQQLNLDHDEARALHRVVRAMHDGECPKCHTLSDARDVLQHDSPQVRCAKCGKTSAENKQKYCGNGSDRDNNHEWERMPRPDLNAKLVAHVCPKCGFRITAEESKAALAEFGKFMERNLEVFEKWRSSRALSAATTAKKPGNPPSGRSECSCDEGHICDGNRGHDSQGCPHNCPAHGAGLK